MSRAGAAGRDRLKAELARQAQRREEAAATANIPFRYFVKRGEVGEIIICDEEPKFWRYEHNYKDDQGKRNKFCACIQETEICPACTALPDSRAYYAMFLTVIDCVPYTPRGGGDEVLYTKKLLVIKSQQQEKWLRRIDTHIAEHGTLRGAVVDVHRSSSDTSPATGDDMEFISHEDLDTKEAADTYFREYKDREGKMHEEDLREITDYEGLFVEPSVEELEEQFNVQPPVGSDRANNRAPRRGGDESPARAPRRSAAKDSDYESTDRDDMEWENNRPTRPSSTSRARPDRGGSTKDTPRPTRSRTKPASESTTRSRTRK